MIFIFRTRQSVVRVLLIEVSDRVINDWGSVTLNSFAPGN